MSAIKVLVVDDSATMRSLISAVLRRDPDITVVGQAGDPFEAREAIKRLNPDVVTLDVEMPNMNGLAFLEKIMRLRPMPVVMVSTLTHVGAEVSLAALEIGAVDCVGKPTAGMPADAAFADLAAKVKAAGRARVRSVADRAPAHDEARSPAAGAFRPDGRIVAIGSSTGGVEALLAVLAAFPPNCPPTLITQHMPGTFTKSFAERLNRTCAAEVGEAYEGAPVEVGRVWLAPGGDYHLEVAGTTRPRCRLVAGEPVNGHRPSVDVLFESVARVAGRAALGVILTGMGRDGAQGLLSMRRAGASTLGQNESTCVVYGMPKVAYEIGAVERQLPLERIGAEIVGRCNLAREAG